MRKASPALSVTIGQQAVLEQLSKSQSAPQREVIRAKALVLAAEGIANIAIADQLGVSPTSVVTWRARFEEEGLTKFGRGCARDAGASRCCWRRRSLRSSAQPFRTRPLGKLTGAAGQWPRPPA